MRAGQQALATSQLSTFLMAVWAMSTRMISKYL